jgi:branched-chain amino acid transport system permease protein
VTTEAKDAMAAARRPPAARRGLNHYESVRFGWLVPLVGVALLAGQMPVNLYVKGIIGLGGAYLIAIAGQNVALGMAGQMIFSQVFFMGVGAYTTFIVQQRAGYPYGVCVLIGLATCLVLALIVGFFVVRLQGFYLAAATLMLPFLTSAIVALTAQWSGGLGGFGGFSTPFSQGNSYTTFVLVIAAAVVWLLHNLSSFGPGWAWRAVRENERAAQSVGIDPAVTKLRAFLLASTLAGLAGVLMAPLLGFVAPETFGVSQMIFFLFASVVGGMGSITGAVVGTAVLVTLNQLITSTDQASPLISGVALVLALVVFPDGIVGSVPKLVSALFKFDLMARLSRWRVNSALGADWVERAHRSQAGGAADSDAEAGPDEPAPRHAALAQREPGPARIFRTRNISVIFGGLVALSGVDIDIPRGQVTGVVGPNGAGKSTLLDVLAGFRTPSIGEVFLDEVNITTMRANKRARHGIATVFQTRQVMADSRVIDNVATTIASDTSAWFVRAALRLRKAIRAEREAYAGAASELARLRVEPEQYLAQTNDLHYGVQRVVEIARGTASRPDFILLDEPAGGLDATEIVTLRRTIETLREHDVGVLIIEHNIGFIRSVCDRLVVLDHGSKIAEGEPGEVLARRDVLEAYFGNAGAHTD